MTLDIAQRALARHLLLLELVVTLATTLSVAPIGARSAHHHREPLPGHSRTESIHGSSRPTVSDFPTLGQGQCPCAPSEPRATLPNLTLRG